MVGLREWLLDIVKQAIREVEAEDIPSMQPELASMVNSAYRELNSNMVWPVNAATRIGIETHAEPVSFEQLQDVALNEQDAYWTKKTPSDV